MVPALLVILPVLTIAQGPARAATPPGWKAYASAKGEFKTVVPATPIERKRSWEAPFGKVEWTNVAVKRGAASFAVNFADLPSGVGSEPAAVLDAARDDAVAQLKGKLQDEKPLDLAGFPARELTIEVPRSVVAGGATGKARLALIGARLYQVIAVQPLQRSKPEEADAFLASFAYAGKATPPAAVAVAATTPAMAAPPAGGPEHVPAGWSRQAIPRGNYSLLLPGKPVETKRQQPIPNGPVVDFYIYSVEPTHGTAFMTLYNEFPSIPGRPLPDPAQAAENGLNSAMASAPGSVLVSRRDVELLGRPGLEFVLDIPAGGQFPTAVRLTDRVVLVDNRLYQTMFVRAQGAADPPELATFLDSIRLDGGGAPGPAVAMPRPAAAPGPAPMPAPAGWQVVESAEGGYRVAFPGAATDLELPAANRPGQIASQSKVLNLGPDGLYTATYAEAPTKPAAAEVARFLDGARDGFIRTLPGAKLIDDSPLTIGDFPARDFRAELAPGPQIPEGAIVWSRMVLDGTRFVQISHVVPKRIVESPDTKIFFDSLQILPR